jgi:hypothetical protein
MMLCVHSLIQTPEVLANISDLQPFFLIYAMLKKILKNDGACLHGPAVSSSTPNIVMIG